MIEIKNLSFSYGKKQVFTDFSTLISNNFATLLGGPNGSGKTTLLQLIGGVQKPDAGSIIINGHNIAKLKTHEQAELRSIAPQRRIFELPFTVQQIFAIIKLKRRAAHTEDVFEALDLYDFFPLKFTERSLGQQQRVSVALALSQQAENYLLDEPLSAQDSAYTQKILDLITVLSKTTGILVISHNTGHLAQYFDESIYLS